MSNSAYLSRLPSQIVESLRELYGSDEDAFSSCSRLAYYLYVEDRIATDRWDYNAFFRMASRRGWSPAEIRRKWAQFQRMAFKTVAGSKETVTLRHPVEDLSIKISPGQMPWMLELQCDGFAEPNYVSEFLKPLREHGWILGEPRSETQPPTRCLVVIKKVRASDSVVVGDLAFLIEQMGMTTADSAEPMRNVAEDVNLVQDDLTIRKGLAEIGAGWRQYRNWLELWRLCHGVSGTNGLKTLARIYELIMASSAPDDIGLVVAHLDEKVEELERSGRATGTTNVTRYRAVAQREPILRRLWSTLETELIQQLASRLTTSVDRPSVNLPPTTTPPSFDGWMPFATGRFEHLNLVGEVLQERNLWRTQLESFHRWTEWQATRRLIELSHEIALDDITEPEHWAWLKSDPDLCCRALELADRSGRFDLVVLMRELLPFAVRSSIHQIAAKASVVQGDDSRALQELAAVANEELDEDSYAVYATALIRMGKHEEALPYVKVAMTHSWLDAPDAPDLLDHLVLTDSLPPDALLDLCDTVTRHVTSVSRAILLESVFTMRIDCVLDVPGSDPETMLLACEDWTEILIAYGEPMRAWAEYERVKSKLKDLWRLKWLDALAPSVPQALTEIEAIGWRGLSNPIVLEEARSMLATYGFPSDLLGGGVSSENQTAICRPRSLILAGANKNIRQQVRTRLVRDHGFDPAAIAEIPSPWEGHIATTEVRSLVDSHELVVAYTAMMKHSLWHQLDVPSGKVVYPPSGGVTGAMKVILERCRISGEAS